jgi:hypothetical protein
MQVGGSMCGWLCRWKKAQIGFCSELSLLSLLPPGCEGGVEGQLLRTAADISPLRAL